MNEYTFRTAKKTDLNQLLELGLDAYGKHRNVLTEANWKIMEANLTDENTYIQLLNTGKCFICEKENKIIGMAFFIPHGNPSTIFQPDWSCIRLAGVSPSYEGKGIGRKLIQKCIDEAIASGEKTIALHTSEFQIPARHLYESLGFSKLKEIDNIYGKKYFLYTMDLTNMNNIINYRRADKNDLQTLSDYRITFALELTGEQAPEKITELREQFRNYFSKAMEENSCIAYIAQQGNHIAGIGAMIIREQPGSFKNPSGKFGYLMSMYTVPSYRRKGICTGILNALINKATQMGITAFELHATKEGEFVYKQNGFDLHIEPTYRKYV